MVPLGLIILFCYVVPTAISSCTACAKRKKEEKKEFASKDSKSTETTKSKTNSKTNSLETAMGDMFADIPPPKEEDANGGDIYGAWLDNDEIASDETSQFNDLESKNNILPKINRGVHLEPKNTLLMVPNKKDSVELAIENKTLKRIGYRVTISDPNYFKMWPRGVGFLEDRCTQRINVSKEDGPAPSDPNPNIEVEWMPAQPNDYDVGLAMKDRPKEVKKRIIKIKFGERQVKEKDKKEKEMKSKDKTDVKPKEKEMLSKDTKEMKSKDKPIVKPREMKSKDAKEQKSKEIKPKDLSPISPVKKDGLKVFPSRQPIQTTSL